MTQGILVAADQKAEWLLPWWWSCYSTHNNFPVAFVDLGLSPDAKAWCEERGLLISSTHGSDFVTPKERVHPDLQTKWSRLYGDGIWESRGAWFLKPHALQLSPFETTLWCDLDGEVCKNLADLFGALSSESNLALAPESEGQEGIFNSGVILYRKGPELALWHEACLRHNHLFVGDEQVLAHLVKEKLLTVQPLSPLYNWLMAGGHNPDAFILHWANSQGKMFIELFGGARGFISEALGVSAKNSAT